MREVPLTLDKTTLDPEEALKMCDENTICIVPIQGVTWTGLNDDVEALDKALDAYNAKTGYDIPIHVDAASGGFILPFLYPEKKWDFRLKWVLSISVSGHKFGLVYPGLGWVCWKGKEYLPEEMSFSVNYLGANITQVGLNFSRPWVVQQSSDKDILIIKPLGGTDAEVIGLYKPLYKDQLNSMVCSYDFRKPSSDDVGANSYPEAARILYNACRLSFRDIAGPFHCLGRLSFEPRPYQMVPLILALKHQVIRLLISDDVGIGKTLESLLIAKELLDRKEIQRFAIICLPHLCEQWQNEIRDKFGLEAEIIRSSTISRLEKNMRANQNVFRDIPFQIISIDYIKSSDRKPMFLQHCPEFIIVDEAHTCAKPKGANKSQQLRHALLSDLSKSERHIVLLTATPHSGNNEEFQSLIGLLKPEFEHFTLEDARQREELSHYFIQRRRADVKPYVGNDMIFPTRVQFDAKYELSAQYHALLMNIIDYVREGVKAARSLGKIKQRYIYWDLLALIRGVMSSPEIGRAHV